jgi:hypothetical protein
MHIARLASSYDQEMSNHALKWSELSQKRIARREAKGVFEAVAMR